MWHVPDRGCKPDVSVSLGVTRTGMLYWLKYLQRAFAGSHITQLNMRNITCYVADVAVASRYRHEQLRNAGNSKHLYVTTPGRMKVWWNILLLFERNLAPIGKV